MDQIHPRDASTAHSLPYMPGLDGVRALAVSAVLAYHLGVPWVSGGFLGVSVFFTLSGYLITSLLLRSDDAFGRIDLIRFWSRRVRRLLPAALLCITVVLVWFSVGALKGSSSFTGDVLASLADVANWRFVFTKTSYADLFSSPSPVLHFWSLAIEEQFYLVFPVLTALALRRSRQFLGIMLVSLLAASVAFTLLTSRPDAVYFSTLTRAAELLIGCLLAFVVDTRVVRTHPRTHIVRQGAGLLGVGLLLAAIATWTLSDSFLYRGGLPAFAIVSAAVVSAAATSGPLSRLLGVWPLRTVGQISYGIYLFHWPIFLALNEERLSLNPVELGAVRVGATIVAATFSFIVIEQPIRQRRVLVGRATPRFAWAALASLAALTLVASQLGPTNSTDLDTALGRFSLFSVDGGPPAATAPSPPSGVPTVAFFGDSTALAPGGAFGQWGTRTGRAELVGGVINFSCGISRGGTRIHHNKRVDVDRGCPNWEATWSAFLDEHHSTAAVVMVGPEDVEDRVLPGTSVVSHIGVDDVDTNLTAEILSATRVIEEHGAVAIWVTSPHIQFGRSLVPPPDEPMNDPARVERFNALLVAASQQHPSMKVIDLAAYMTAIPGGEFNSQYRPDGIHLTNEGADDVTLKWMGDAILAEIPPTT